MQVQVHDMYKLDRHEYSMITHVQVNMHKKQKRQDWDHKAYHDAPSAIKCACHPLPWVTAQYIALGTSYMPCDPNLVSSVFYTIPIFPF